MSRELLSVLNKEWTERRSTFWLGIVFVTGFLGYCIAYEIEYRTRTFIAGYYHTCMMYGQLGAVLLAMKVATGEYSQRTLKFSSSLPISLSKVAWSRLLAAWGCLVAPMLFGAIIATLILASGFIEQAGFRSDVVDLPDRPSLSRIEAIGFLWTTIVIAVACALQLSTFIALLGTRCRSEGAVGFLGAIVALLLGIFDTIRPTLDSFGQFFLSDWIGGLIPNSLLISWGYGQWDGSSYTDLDLAPLVVGPVILCFLVTAVLAFWFTNNYGRRLDLGSLTVSKWRRWVPALPNLHLPLSDRWRSQSAALVWLNARQSVPLSLAGLMIAGLIGFIGILGRPHTGMTLEHIRGALVENTWTVGVLWAAVVAVSLFGSELKPDLEQFWRSRPIAPGRWFWIKFAVGLIAVLGALDGIPALIAWNAPYLHASGRMGLVHLACMPLIHAQVYATAVAAICQLRRAIPAAMVAILLFFVTDAVMQSIPFHERLSTLDVHNALNAKQLAGEKLDLTSEGYPIVYGSVLAIIALATALARRGIVPPRAANLGLLAAIAFALCSSGQARCDDQQTVNEIVAGIREREAIVKDYRIRLKTRRHRTDAFYEFEAANQAKKGRRQQRTETTSATPRDEELEYELIERPPCRVLTTFGANGAVKSMTAFDGTTQRDYTSSISRAWQGTIMASTRAAGLPMINPESTLMSCGGAPLIGFLEGRKLHQVIRREVDGEQLIDLTISNRSSGEDASSSADPHSFEYQITINISRNYWPIHIRSEFSDSQNGIPFSVIDVKADGWIDAGPIVYPRRIEQTNYLSIPAATSPSKMVHPVDGRSKPEKSEIQEVEIAEIAINTNPSDGVFRPSFPAGALVWDLRDRKQYEVDSTGTPQLYQPKPKGIRGAVSVYHIVWISIATVYLFMGQNKCVARCANAFVRK